jgi:hypothetical protein
MRLNESMLKQKIAGVIKKDCSDIIKVYKKLNMVLYRGSDNQYKNFQFIVPRTDRKPRSTKIVLSNALDEAFYGLFGWRPRSEGVFATGNMIDAGFYGKHSYIVFPKNNFKFIWSPFIEDLYASIQNIDEVNEVVLKYTDKDIEKAVYSYHEVMIKCDGYYVVDDYTIMDDYILN